MSIYLEITQLENGDIVLREAEGDAEPRTHGEITVHNPPSVPVAELRGREPLVRISFSDEVKDMLGGELVGVAEAMIDAATDFLGGETIELEPDTPSPPTVH
ncbi:MAG: hypothetical protein AB7I04_24940 [Pseudomonadales bacterium]